MSTHEADSVNISTCNYTGVLNCALHSVWVFSLLSKNGYIIDKLVNTFKKQFGALSENEVLILLTCNERNCNQFRKELFFSLKQKYINIKYYINELNQYHS